MTLPNLLPNPAGQDGYDVAATVLTSLATGAVIPDDALAWAERYRAVLEDIDYRRVTKAATLRLVLPRLAAAAPQIAKFLRRQSIWHIYLERGEWVISGPGLGGRGMQTRWPDLNSAVTQLWTLHGPLEWLP